MNRDMKVGLSLGVLLVGIVGALFLRREAAPKGDQPPALKGGAALDEKIAEQAHGPYITGPEDFLDQPSAAGDVKTPAAGESNNPSAANRSVPGHLTSREPGTPNPIQLPASGNENAAVPSGPDHNRDWVAGTGGGLRKAAAGAKAGDAAATKPASSTGSRTHVIEAGDTLSGLAQRYLGSSARFREIYDANRHVLRSADDLPEGTTINIPATAVSEHGKSASSEAAGTPSGATVGDAAISSQGVTTAPASLPGRKRRSPAAGSHQGISKDWESEKKSTDDEPGGGNAAAGRTSFSSRRLPGAPLFKRRPAAPPASMSD